MCNGSQQIVNVDKQQSTCQVIALLFGLASTISRRRVNDEKLFQRRRPYLCSCLVRMYSLFLIICLL